MLGRKFASARQLLGRVWALSAPYYQSDEKWKARGMLAAVVGLSLALVYMSVQFNDWRGAFYDALQNKNATVFWEQLWRFCYLAVGFVAIAVYKFYLTQVLQMRWRAWMTRHYLQRWLGNHAFYQLELARFANAGDKSNPDNPDQRIQEDINLFTDNTVSLSLGLLDAVVTLLSFVGILWALSGDFGFTLAGHTFNIPGFMVWMAVLYCGVGSVITYYIGRPQIRLNFQQQLAEANFRHHMVRVREYAESIALSRGGPAEGAQLDTRLSAVLGNYLRLIRAQKNLIWFTSFFSQASVVFPFIVAAPRFFSGSLQLGGLMQISSAFGEVQGALSWFVGNFSQIAAWRATTDRLTGFEASFKALSLANKGQHVTNSVALASSALSVSLPDGTPLLRHTTLHATPGMRIALQGASGSGKSTLFRVLAGIWPHYQGSVACPDGAVFISQRPYFPNGSLREALAYPESAGQYSDAALQHALSSTQLPQLCDQLDRVDGWNQKLSGGEQQRLALARVLLKNPTWVFADEATSALDEASENLAYKTLLSLVESNNGAIISIAHRKTVIDLHTTHWQLVPSKGEARFELNATL